ncbi:transmembrane protein, putative (macronuclear) [Tetrahymena thermophila SB210]|uniref:Transmembrane protein, putative n=1 Tax=Tetrahymena thermophila (strain SB210) TaxID=312017 RepID=W7XEN4_TETTS|nr:transmembrane protein, putative [Tetrahymena thermophila SB210]EWS72346.1 transmembrane protein, putative [Tetrahymena thermophila SB210]|eukprot:XP_012655123.1 transmembrane protein, putative [Tetrahymena thermophila SB210]
MISQALNLKILKFNLSVLTQISRLAYLFQYFKLLQNNLICKRKCSKATTYQTQYHKQYFLLPLFLTIYSLLVAKNLLSSTQKVSFIKFLNQQFYLLQKNLHISCFLSTNPHKIICYKQWIEQIFYNSQITHL